MIPIRAHPLAHCRNLRCAAAASLRMCVCDATQMCAGIADSQMQRRRAPRLQLLPEKAYDDEPPEPPVIIIMASMTITGDSAPARS